MAMTVKLRKCRECGEKYQPKNTMVPVCDNIECKVSYATRIAEKSKANRIAKAKREASKEKRNDRERLAKLKPGYLASKAQQAVNSYIRVRDHDLPCISCGKPADDSGNWDAGHLKTRGANSFLRYNTFNISKQCVRCNQHLSGNTAEHERGIVERYGIERLDFLNNSPKSRRYSDEYLIRLAEIFRRRTRMLKKRKGIL